MEVVQWYILFLFLFTGINICCCRAFVIFQHNLFSFFFYNSSDNIYLVELKSSQEIGTTAYRSQAAGIGEDPIRWIVSHATSSIVSALINLLFFELTVVEIRGHCQI